MLITGGTAGIGAALARRYANRAELLISGRMPVLDAAPLLPAGAAYVQADQAAPEVAAKAVADTIDERGWSALDLAILNAGTGKTGDPADDTPQQIREMLDVNLMAAIELAHRLHPLLAPAKGTLVLIGSTARKGAPAFATYAAAKAGLDGLGRALAHEWRDNIRVKVIHPGPVATDIHAKAGFDPGAARRFFASPDAIARMIERAISGRGNRRTISFAHYLVDAFASRRHRAG